MTDQKDTITVYEVVINYRSGKSVTVLCTDFAVQRNKTLGTTMVDMQDPNPDPLLIGVSDIESIWQVDTHERPRNRDQ